MPLVVGQGVGGGGQGGFDEGEADNRSMECLVKRMKPVMIEMIQFPQESC